jgi:hypothetical protein
VRAFVANFLLDSDPTTLATSAGINIIRFNWGEGQLGQRPKKFGRLCQSAGVAQLAEHNVANVVVVGSIPITRSFLLFPPWVLGT